MNGAAGLGNLWHSVQSWLFPMLEDELGELDDQHRRFIAVCEVCAPQKHIGGYRWVGNGYPPKDRLSFCKAFIAKAVWDFPTTRALLDRIRHDPALRRLCGWETTGEMPSEATFSRAFAVFARDRLPQRIHEAMIRVRHGDKMVGHVSRDGTAIHAREKAAKKEHRQEAVPKKRGRRPKGEPCPPPAPTRLRQQLGRSLAENLADLPQDCDWGCKKNSQCRVECWRGYKLHIDSIDGDLPVSWLVTSARRPSRWRR